MAGRVIAIVPARGGSEGIAHKNVRPLAGVPLIRWTLASALAACDEVIVSSEDDEILDVATMANVRLHRRSPMLATARTPDLPVIVDAYRAIAQEPDDLLVLLRPTSPFRRAEEIREVVESLRMTGADSVRSVLRVQASAQKMYRAVSPARHRDDRAEPDVWYLEPATDRHRANHPRQTLVKTYLACGFIDALRADVLLGATRWRGT